jgi:L-ascorbate metabolism protein UlaG (beta-lactamase superfamily)
MHFSAGATAVCYQRHGANLRREDGSMSSPALYLRPDVAVELLFNDWYAWPYLISPATAAMCVANAHLKIMQSFAQNPQLHVAALKNPAMRGGPFVDHEAEHAAEVGRLAEKTAARLGHFVELAEAVKTLDRLLGDEGTGPSLEPLYKKVPAPLQGLVELVYDLNHHASIRLLEGLFYRSRYYDPTLQTAVMAPLGEARRPFVFSTPRLPRPRDVRLELPFANAGLDELYRARAEPRSLALLEDLLHVAPSERDAFAACFTAQAPRPSVAYAGNDIRVRYFGHACVLVETAGVSILFDPVIGHEGSAGAPRFTHADLPPRIDYVLLTHNHQDHVLFEPLLELRHRVGEIVVPASGGGTLADPSLRRILHHVGFPRVRELGEMESIAIAGGSITGLPFLGEHADLSIQTKLAYALRLGARSLLFMADSNNLEPRVYERVHDVIGDVDVIFIGMECEGAPMSFLYGYLFTKPLVRKIDQSRRLNGSNYERAADIVDRFAPRQVYVYAMGQEPWLAHLMSLPYTDASPQMVESNRLIEHCHQRGITAERPYCHKEIHLPLG